MSALALGLVAALMWGFHDISVRFVSQKTPLMASLMAVLIFGAIFHLALMAALGSGFGMPPLAWKISVLAGVTSLIASFGLYGAFQRGPVRLVAPIIASFPVLSVGWAVLNGTHISLWQWIAVLTIIIGVSLVAALSDGSSENVRPKAATIALALLSSVGFAGTFAFGQMASALAGELPVTLVGRVVAILLLLCVMLVLRLPLWPGRSALPLLALMGIADVMALLSVNAAGHLSDAQYASVASSTFGMLTIVLAWAFLRERMSALQWIGCLVTFLGIGFLAF